MNARGHITHSIFVLAAFRASNPDFILGYLIGSVILDLDHHSTYITKIIPIGLHNFVEHRGIVHSVFFSYVFGFLFSVLSFLLGFSYIIGIGVFFGALHHLYDDDCTSRLKYVFWYPTKPMKIKKQPLKR